MDSEHELQDFLDKLFTYLINDMKRVSEELVQSVAGNQLRYIVSTLNIMNDIDAIVQDYNDTESLKDKISIILLAEVVYTVLENVLTLTKLNADGCALAILLASHLKLVRVLESEEDGE